MSKKTRICYIINSFEVGGAETVALDLASRHNPDQFDVTVAAILEKKENLDSVMLNRFKERGVRTVSFVQNSFRNPLNVLKLFFYFKSNHFDIVHAHNRPGDIWSMRIAKMANVPLFLWTRHLVYQDMTPRQISSYKKLSLSAGPVLAVSDAVRKNCIEVEGISPQKVITVVNGINTERFAPIDHDSAIELRHSLGLTDKEFMLLFVGRMNQQKAPESFPKLVWMLRQRGVPVRGFMCGHGPIADEIKKQIEFGSDGVRMLGLRDDIPQLLASCDLFVSTSRNEGLPLNVMEAMSVGAAFVAPGIEQISCLMTGFPELEYCLTSPPPAEGNVPDDTIQTWADKITDLLENPEKRVAAGLAARKVIQESYSLDQMVAEYERVFKMNTHKK